MLEKLIGTHGTAVIPTTQLQLTIRLQPVLKTDILTELTVKFVTP